MDVTFWGVRGSVAAPGPDFNRYGGNTTCVSVRGASGALLILDAGTGIIELGGQLMGGRFGRGEGEANLLLTHTHWDHIQGFPFFSPVYVPGNKITIHGPSESPAALEGVMEGQMDPHFSPVQSLSNLGAHIDFQGFLPGSPVDVGGMRITGEILPHGRSHTLAYRLEEGGRSVALITDVQYPDEGPSEPARALMNKSDCLIHDCTFTPEDQIPRRSRGYSSIADAARAAASAGVGTLVMFHYDQDYTDVMVDDLSRRCRELLDMEQGGPKIKLLPAREGLTITV